MQPVVFPGILWEFVDFRFLGSGIKDYWICSHYRSRRLAATGSSHTIIGSTRFRRVQVPNDSI